MLPISIFLTSMSTALAVPQIFNHQGRLLDENGLGLEGVHDLSIRLVDEESAGTILWEETVSIPFSNGYYSAVLGGNSNNPLDESILAIDSLWLELRIDGDTLTPRHPMTAIPYATMSKTTEDLEGGYVNASEISVNDTLIIDSDGSYVGPLPATDWSNIQNIPADIADGDDDSDTDTLAGLGCQPGELAGWDGSQWTCVSDGSLSEADVEDMISNGAIDLHGDTTIDGQPIMTTGDGDTLSGLSCLDGELAKWDNLLAEWICGVDIDTDTVLSEADVENYITNGAVDLSTGSTLGGDGILTDSTVLSPDWSNIQNRPAGLDDGDDDTQLSESQVENYVTNGSIDLSGGSKMAGADLLTQPSGCADGQIMVYTASTQSWNCGEDTDTTLTAIELQAVVETLSLDLQNRPSVNGSPVLSEDSSLNPANIDASGSTAGQVLTSDGSNTAWADAVSGGCEVVESIIGSPVRMRLQCGTASFIVEGSTLAASSLGGSSRWTYDVNCALDLNNEIKCWGHDQYGEVTNAPSGTFTEISGGSYYWCGLETAGTIKCWGRDNYNLVSDAPAGTFTKVKAGRYHACAISTGGGIECWGYDNYNQVNGSPNSGNYTDLGIGSEYSCALKQGGGVDCWGNNWQNMVSGAPSSGNFVQLVSTDYTSCARTATGQIECWGYDYGNAVSDSPSGQFIDMDAGTYYWCAIHTNGSVHCWGQDSGGTVNDNPGGTDSFTSITSGDSHLCAITSSGGVKCWGSSSYTSGTPTSGNWTSIHANAFSTCGILASGNVICWGSSGGGQLNPP